MIPDKIPRLPECFNDPGLCASPYRPKNEAPGVILASAVLRDNLIWTGKRHCTIITAVFSATDKAVMREEQGFITDTGMFLSREQAMELARRNGQLPSSFNKKVLTSEDLW